MEGSTRRNLKVQAGSNHEYESFRMGIRAWSGVYLGDLEKAGKKGF